MKFSKHEHGKVKKQKHSFVSPEHDGRPAIRNDSHAHNTRMYSIYSKVMDFQSKTNKSIGLSHILQQHTTEDIKAAVSLDHNYAEP